MARAMGYILPPGLKNRLLRTHYFQILANTFGIRNLPKFMSRTPCTALR
jgi:hypothetical protein